MADDHAVHRPDRLLTPGEVAKVFGVHVRTVIHWADNGRLASQRTVGGHDGVANFFAVFIEVLQDRTGASIEIEPDAKTGDFLFGFLQGTRQALYEHDRDSITLTISQVNPRTVGALIALFERVVGLYASLVNINAYDQPGVEAGKKAGKSITDLQKTITVASLKPMRADGYGQFLSENAFKHSPRFGPGRALQSGVNANIVDVYNNLERI